MIRAKDLENTVFCLHKNNIEFFTGDWNYMFNIAEQNLYLHSEVDGSLELLGHITDVETLKISYENLDFKNIFHNKNITNE